MPLSHYDMECLDSFGAPARDAAMIMPGMTQRVFDNGTFFFFNPWNLTVGDDIVCRVRAVNANGAGAWSNWSSGVEIKNCPIEDEWVNEPGLPCNGDNCWTRRNPDTETPFSDVLSQQFQNFDGTSSESLVSAANAVIAATN